MDTNKYTAKAVEAVQGAQNIALEHDNQEIKPEHFLYALLNDENGLIYKILTGLQVSADSLKGAVENVIKSFPRVSGEGASMYLGNEAAKVVAAAEKYAKKDGDAYVGVEHLFEGILDNQTANLKKLFSAYGVDKAAFCEYLNKYYKNAFQPESVSGAVTRGDGRTWPLDPVFDAAIEAGEIVYEDAIYWQFFSIPGRKDCIAFNCPEFFDIHDADDGDSLTEVQLQGKQAILRQLLFYRRHFGGFEGAYIASVAQFVGVRESRRAVTEHVITAEELLTHTKFDDAICQSNYPVDVHGRKLRCETIRPAAPDEPPFYEGPLRALIVRDVDNLLVAGRNLGAEFVAQSSIRIIPTCRAMGEAAGIAAAFASGRSDKNAHSISGRDVRAEMLRRGAQFADRPGLK